MKEIDSNKFKYIEKAYREEHRQFVRTAQRYSSDGAEDIVQQAIVRLAKANIKIEHTKHAAALIVIYIKWEGWSFLQKEKRRKWFEKKASEEPTTVEYQLTFLDKEIEDRILNKLDEKERTILIKKIFHGLEMKEISTQLHINQDNLYDKIKIIISKLNGTYKEFCRKRPCIHKASGVTYPSLPEACEALGLNYSYQRNRLISLRSKNRSEDAIFEYVENKN